MDLPSEEVEIPMPLNSTYAGVQVHGHVPNMFHQHHYHDHHHDKPLLNHLHVSSSNGPPMPITQNHENHHNHDHVLLSNNKKQQGGGKLRYRECLKNHAASMGGNVKDGCGEFMPSGEEGTIEALTCSVCSCHRNFHRKEVEGEPSSSPLPYDCYPSPQPHLMINNRGRKVINLGHHKSMLSPAGVFGVGVGVGGYPTATAGTLVSGGRARSVPIIPYNMGSLLVSSDQSDDQEEGGVGGTAAASAGVTYMGLPPPPPSYHHNQTLKKRFRTKFTPEQKEKMFNFAEKVGWKIQKQEDSVVQQFCQEIGIKRRVLKVWMHNNKHNLTKKNSSTTDA